MPDIFPRIIFQMSLPEKPTSELLWGVLIFRETPLLAGRKLEATSGINHYQYNGSWNQKGKGCIPPDIAIRPANWTVSTQRVWLPNVKGVAGGFYPISPFSVPVGRLGRGDFGIHKDGNVAGSQGCVVLKPGGHWIAFEKIMEDVRRKGIQSIPLNIMYS